MSYGRLINDPAQSGSVHVYEREDKQVYTIAFANREWVEGFTWGSAVLVLMIFGFIPYMLVIPSDIYALAYVAVGVVLFFLTKNPHKTRRTIILDYERNRFVVTRNRRETFSAPLESFGNWTVDDHPETAFERDQRARTNKRGAGRYEKQHVLIGWFGLEGAQRVDLVSRYEWPKLYSLQVVGGAINWVRRTAPSARDLVTDDEHTERPGGLGPPLD